MSLFHVERRPKVTTLRSESSEQTNRANDRQIFIVTFGISRCNINILELSAHTMQLEQSLTIFFYCVFHVNKRVKTKEDLLFRGSTQANEVPFKMFNDSKDITVELTDLEEGWEMHKTPSKQVSYT